MSNCRARQYSDQMQCVCGLAWDVNDPDPPECPKEDRVVLTGRKGPVVLWGDKTARGVGAQEARRTLKQLRETLRRD